VALRGNTPLSVAFRHCLILAIFRRDERLRPCVDRPSVPERDG